MQWDYFTKWMSDLEYYSQTVFCLEAELYQKTKELENVKTKLKNTKEKLCKAKLTKEQKGIYNQTRLLENYIKKAILSL